MSCVSEEHRGTLRSKTGARWICALVVLALVAGPGFFTAALFNALFRDVPPSSAVVASANASVPRSNHEIAGRLLSPLVDTGSMVSEVTPNSAADGSTPDNPVKAYLKLTGTSDFNALPVSSEDAAGQAANATYRTVCVRLCDGSYFPISEAAAPDQFKANEAQCQSQCGSPARLFVYAKDRETPLQMRDLSGNSYLELESAFRFHTRYDAQCSCRSQPWTVAAKTRHRQYAELAVTKNRSKPALPIATIASPAGLPSVAEVSKIGAVADSVAINVIRPLTPVVTLSATSRARVVSTRAGTLAEISAIEAERARSERIAAVSERTAILASLELAGVGTSLRRAVRPVEALEQPEAVTLEFFSFASTPDEPSPTPKKVVVVDLSGPARANAQRTASDILMRNLNPHF